MTIKPIIQYGGDGYREFTAAGKNSTYKSRGSKGLFITRSVIEMKRNGPMILVIMHGNPGNSGIKTLRYSETK
ncbi:MAG TPA: hypothetical protein VK783_11085 [Bacteroidia bacterium]|nr:hypothetical protein [Bacteroidia bacterium]